MLNMKKLLTKILTGFVKKTGDTMTGTLKIDGHLDILNARNATIYSGQDLNDSRSSDYWNSYFQVYDKNNTQGGAVTGLSTVFGTDGAVRVVLHATRKNSSGTRISNQINLVQKADGSRSVSVSDAAAWRAALGINNTMFKYKKYTFAYTVAGNSNVEITANNLGISVPSGYRVAGVYYAAPGKAAVSVDLIAADNTGTGNVIRLRNHSSSSQSGTCTVGITWVKTDFISAL